MSTSGMPSKRKRRLSPSEKYELFVSVLTGQATQREAAALRGRPFDRGARVQDGQAGSARRVVRCCSGTAGGHAGGCGAGGGAGRDRPAPGDGHRAGCGVAPARGKSALGLTAGAVPARVDAGVKAGLLQLVDHAGEHGWSTARACRLLGLDPDRAADWRARRALDRLADLPPGGGAVHGLLETERAAIVELFHRLGRDRPVSSQARRSRLPTRAGARRARHDPPRSGRRRLCAAGPFAA